MGEVGSLVGEALWVLALLGDPGSYKDPCERSPWAALWSRRVFYIIDLVACTGICRLCMGSIFAGWTETAQQRRFPAQNSSRYDQSSVGPRKPLRLLE